MGAIGLHAKFSAIIDRKVKLVDLFKTMELLNNSYAFYMLAGALLCLDGKTLGYWERERRGKERKKEKN